MKQPDEGTRMSATDKAEIDAKLEQIVRLAALGMSQLGTLRRTCEDLEAWVKSLPEPELTTEEHAPGERRSR